MRVDEESLEMSLEMSKQSAWEGHQLPPRTGREDSTDSADRSISKRRKWSSGAR